MASKPEVGPEQAIPTSPSSSNLGEQTAQGTGSIETKASSAPGGDIATDPGTVVSTTVPPAVPSEAQPTSVESTPQQAIEAEETLVPSTEDNSDADSSYGDEIQSFTTSLKESVTAYKFENGRRYHAQEDAKYFLPNDEKEMDRLDLFHHLLTLRCDDKLHLAPIGPRPQKILDLGTGSGIWCIEMGSFSCPEESDAYPSAEVRGIDLSPTQPTMVPVNVQFEVDDIEDTWIYSQKFDYIHCRYLAGSIKDWPKLMAQAYEFLTPGGYVEFQDFDMKFYSTDGTFVPGSAPDVWTSEIVEALKSFDREAEPGPKLEQWVKDAGFENIHHQLLPIPCGLWPRDKRFKEIGACDLSMFLEGLEGISLRALVTSQRWSAEEVMAFLPGVRKVLLNKKIHTLHNMHVVWAQKPLEGN